MMVYQNITSSLRVLELSPVFYDRCAFVLCSHSLRREASTPLNLKALQRLVVEHKIEEVAPSREARRHLAVQIVGNSMSCAFYIHSRELYTRFARFLAVSDQQDKIWAVHLLTSLLHNGCQPKVKLRCTVCSVGVLYSHIVSTTLQ